MQNNAAMQFQRLLQQMGQGGSMPQGGAQLGQQLNSPVSRAPTQGWGGAPYAAGTPEFEGAQGPGDPIGQAGFQPQMAPPDLPPAYNFMQRGDGFDLYDVPLVGPALGGLYEGITNLPGQIQSGLGGLSGNGMMGAIGNGLQNFTSGVSEYQGNGPSSMGNYSNMSNEEIEELIMLLQQRLQ